jgi:hypothetical protein
MLIVLGFDVFEIKGFLWTVLISLLYNVHNFEIYK